jgi:hypothetical protein
VAPIADEGDGVRHNKQPRHRELPTCARDGCGRKVTIVAWRNLDNFCSTACFRAVHGTDGWEDELTSQGWADRQFERKQQDSRYADAGGESRWLG